MLDNNLLVLLLFLLGGCNWREDKAIHQDPITDRGIQAFSQSVFVYTRKNCVSCHEHKQPPLFAQANLDTAYSISKNYVNFREPQSSILHLRVTNGHCGENCQTDGKELLESIQFWWENGERDIPPAPPSPLRVKSTSQAIPSLILGGPFKTLQWNLSEWVEGLWFQIEVQRFDIASFRFRKPRFITKENSVSVKDLGIVLNDMDNPLLTTYSSINKTIDPFSRSALSSRLMLASIPSQAPRVALSFMSIAPTFPHHCRAFSTFSKELFPILQDKCFRCHNQNHHPAYEKFPMTTDLESLCAGASERLDEVSASHSALIVYPFSQALDHPVRVLSDTERVRFLSWIEEERDYD